MTTRGRPQGELEFALLDEELLRDFVAFSCGDEEWHTALRDFLLEDALTQARGRFSVTFVFYTPLQEPVGYLSLSAAQVNRADTGIRPRPPYPVVPAVLIGRLGIDRRYQGRGYGRQVMGLVRDWARDLVVGCRVLALQVDVRNEDAITFYTRLGFEVAPIEVARGMQWMLFDLGGRDAVL